MSLLQEIKRIKTTVKPNIKLRHVQRAATLQQMPQNSTPKDKDPTEISDTDFTDPEANIFAGKTFCFPIKGVDLSQRRVAIFTSLIRNRGGTLLPLQQALEKGCNYAISSWKLPRYQLSLALEQATKNERQKGFEKILDYHYIIDCQKQNRLLPSLCYEICDGKSSSLMKLGHQEHDQLSDCELEKERSSSTVATISSDTLESRSLEWTDSTGRSAKIGAQLSKDHFACQKGSSSSQFTVNQYICEELMKLHTIHESEKDTGRKIAYLRAASAIKTYHKQIESEKDIAELRGIGKKMMSKIKELLSTGRIQKLEKLKHSEQTLVCQELMKVWGIGPSKANELYLQGVHSLQMLSQKQELLNKNQRIGLKYVEDFSQRIPRLRVQQIFEHVKKKIHELVQSETLHIVEACGSFRRGKETCGDIDIIITRRDGQYEPQLLVDLIEKLAREGFLTDHLSIPSCKPVESGECVSYMGVCVFKEKPHHRIDIKYYPLRSFSFATLYFTGSDLFNRSMRLYARKKGYSLSDHGLVPVDRNAANEKVWKGRPIGLYQEKDIFEFLGLDYKTPAQRNI